MRVYELVLVLKTSLTTDKRKKLLDTVRGWLKDAKIIKEEDWGQKVLSYPIKKEINGFYTFLQVEIEQITSDFEKKLLTQEHVLRHLLLRKK